MSSWDAPDAASWGEDAKGQETSRVGEWWEDAGDTCLRERAEVQGTEKEKGVEGEGECEEEDKEER